MTGYEIHVLWVYAAHKVSQRCCLTPFYYIHMVKNVANVAGFRGLGVMIQTIENYKQNYMYTLIISAATFIVNKIGCEVLN